MYKGYQMETCLKTLSLEFNTETSLSFTIETFEDSNDNTIYDDPNMTHIVIPLVGWVKI